MSRKVMIYETKLLILNFLLILFLVNSAQPKNIENQEINYFSYLNDTLTLLTTNTWYEFNLDCAWSWIITLKSKNAIQLKRMNLQWSGENLDTEQISASLYQKKERNNHPIPIEKNFICDGKWNKEKQQLVFEPNKKLIAVNKYHLVLSFPEKFKSHLKAGTFTLSDDNSLEIEKIA